MQLERQKEKLQKIQLYAHPLQHFTNNTHPSNHNLSTQMGFPDPIRNRKINKKDWKFDQNRIPNKNQAMHSKDCCTEQSKGVGSKTYLVK